MHRIEILRARYVLQLLVGYIVKKFQPKIPTYMSRRIFFSLFKKVIFWGRFLNYEVVSIANSEAFALMKKAKTTCHSIVDNQSIFSGPHFPKL